MKALSNKIEKVPSRQLKWFKLHDIIYGARVRSVVHSPSPSVFVWPLCDRASFEQKKIKKIQSEKKKAYHARGKFEAARRHEKVNSSCHIRVQ